MVSSQIRIELSRIKKIRSHSPSEHNNILRKLLYLLSISTAANSGLNGFVFVSRVASLIQICSGASTMRISKGLVKPAIIFFV